MDRTINTLFMISSLDGKISTGEIDSRDFGKDFKSIKELKEGYKQYLELEQKTDLFSLNSGKVMKKIGMNLKNHNLCCPEVSFIIIDNNHLTQRGIKNLIKGTKKLFLITKNKNHPAFKFKKEIELIYYPKKINFSNLFKKLKKEYKIKNITIQSGGILNSIFLRENLIDKISFVIAPVLIGGEKTPTLVDGNSLKTKKDLEKMKKLKLKKCEILKQSFIHLTYDVLK
jgi:2,5-diamino-6-(ribosylamino)-4(3H)-pyrimidinone 5'-phosphate reductase